MKIFDAIENKVIVPIAVTLFIISCGWMLVESLSRQFFNKSYNFSEELVIFSLIWAIFLTLGKGGQKNVHIVVDLFTSRFSKKTLKITSIFNSVIGLIYAAFLVYVGISYVQHLNTTGITSHSSLRIPMGIVLLVIPIGMTFFGLFYIKELKKTITNDSNVTEDSAEIQKESNVPIESQRKNQELQSN
jgi:TRAP-type C4-dicarboxylate transport system permease small subunit